MGALSARYNSPYQQFIHVKRGGISGPLMRMAPANITLLPLPPYSPELNPMENVWDYLRGNKLSSLVRHSYEAIVAACKEAWHFLIGDPDRINSLAHRSWAWVNPQGGWYNVLTTIQAVGTIRANPIVAAPSERQDAVGALLHPIT
jgi:hypothetical protein